MTPASGNGSGGAIDRKRLSSPYLIDKSKVASMDATFLWLLFSIDNKD